MEDDWRRRIIDEANMRIATPDLNLVLLAANLRDMGAFLRRSAQGRPDEDQLSITYKETKEFSGMYHLTAFLMLPRARGEKGPPPGYITVKLRFFESYCKLLNDVEIDVPQ